MAFTTVSGSVPSVPSMACQERSPVLPKLQSSACSFSTTWRSASSLQRLPNFLEQKLQAVRPPPEQCMTHQFMRYTKASRPQQDLHWQFAALQPYAP